MGKGDRKTAKGKRYNSSYGNARGRGNGVPAAAAAAPAAKAAKTATKAVKSTKTVAKKAVKKAAAE